ncbi:MAG: hypothetical protein WCR67_05145 [Bacilli bacterium]
MNRNIIFLLPVLAMSLAGCTNSSASASDVSVSKITSSEISSDESTEVSTSVSTEETSVKEESLWGEDYTESIIDNLSTDIPYLNVPSFDLVMSEDSFGDPLVCMYLYVEESEIVTKLNEYAEIVSNQGYAVEYTTNSQMDDSGVIYTYDVYYADKVITSSLGIELQFLEGSYRGKECLGIFAYNYIYDDPSYWPTNLVTYLLGQDVPHLEDTGEYSYVSHINQDTYNYIDMVIKNVSDDSDTEYASLLEGYGYTVTDEEYDEETYEYLGRFAYADDNSHVIQFGLTSYGFEIYIYDTSELMD